MFYLVFPRDLSWGLFYSLLSPPTSPRKSKSCKFAAYADDAALLVSASTLKQLKSSIELSISKVQNWYTRNGLLINPDKTEFMVLKTRSKMAISINNGEKQLTIESKDCLKVLGMKIDSQLT